MTNASLIEVEVGACVEEAGDGPNTPPPARLKSWRGRRPA